MKIIDGSFGEGGGQILRSSLTLSLLTGQPFRIENVRAGRSKPGLLRQHLTAVSAAARIGNAKTHGAELGSQLLSFVPGKVAAGAYRFDIGSAGSTMLVLQTILLPLMLCAGPSTVELIGGTHAPNSPSFDFLERAFLPLLRRMGARVQAVLDTPGYYPAGGGRVRVGIEPLAALVPLVLCERGPLLARRARADVSRLPESIAARELAVLARYGPWEPGSLETRPIAHAHGPGNVVTVELVHGNVTEVITAFGERGLPAEQVAARVVERLQAYERSQAAVAEYLADQLMLPVAMAGSGSYTAVDVSLHATTNAEVIRAFLGHSFRFEDVAESCKRISLP